jgi:hypothetical protein
MNIQETKKSSTTNINCFNNDCLKERKLMYENPKIKFPKKRVPTNNQIFVNKPLKKTSKKILN